MLSLFDSRSCQAMRVSWTQTVPWWDNIIRLTLRGIRLEGVASACVGLTEHNISTEGADNLAGDRLKTVL